MIAVPLLLLALMQVPQPAAARHAESPVRDTSAVSTLVPIDTPVDTPVVRPRPRAIEYSDLYGTRLTIHRIASYTMLPMFAAEYALGQNLLQDASPPGWMKPAHGVAAGGIAVLFGINTITGLWNLWDSRQDPAGRTRRVVHSALMLASDAGFALAGALAPGEDDGFRNYASDRHDARVHRDIAIGSIALSTIGTGMMWLWKQ